MRSKGQAISADFMMAMILVLIIVSMAASSWDRSMYLINKKTGTTEMRRMGLSIGNMLVKSPGVPDDWDSTNVLTLGLVDEQNVLSKSKVQEFIGMSESDIKGLLGIETFEFSFVIRGINGTKFHDYGNHPTVLTDVIVVRRIAIYEGVSSYVEFGMWRE